MVLAWRWPQDSAVQRSLIAKLCPFHTCGNQLRGRLCGKPRKYGRKPQIARGEASWIIQ
jgi:hypothetical protein